MIISSTMPMNISTDKLLDSFKRVSWNYFIAILKSKDIDSGNGWEKTIKKLKLGADNDNEYRQKIMSLYPLYEEHLLSDEKVVKIYQKKL